MLKVAKLRLQHRARPSRITLSKKASIFPILKLLFESYVDWSKFETGESEVQSRQALGMHNYRYNCLGLHNPHICALCILEDYAFFVFLL